VTNPCLGTAGHYALPEAQAPRRERVRTYTGSTSRLSCRIHSSPDSPGHYDTK